MGKVGVVNASPLIFLSRGGHLDILGRFYNCLMVPSAVMNEILARGINDPTASAVRAFPQIEVVTVEHSDETVAAWGLGTGETAVISLASQVKDAEAILDDLLGRRCASVLGIPVRGTLGIVMLAKQHGMIPAARPVIEDLLRGGMYLDRRTIDVAMRRVNE